MTSQDYSTLNQNDSVKNQIEAFIYKRPANLKEEVLEKHKKNSPTRNSQNKSNMRESNNRSQTQNLNKNSRRDGTDVQGGSLTPSKNNKFSIHTKHAQSRNSSRANLVENQSQKMMYNTTNNNSKNYNQLRNSSIAKDTLQSVGNSRVYNYRDSKLLQDIKSKDEMMDLRVRNNEYDQSKRTDLNMSTYSEKIPIRVDSKSNNGKSRFNQNYTKKQTLNLEDLDKTNT